MDYKEVLNRACKEIKSLEGHLFDVLTISKPVDVEYAQDLAKIISKISPLVGNLIEMLVVKSLNETVNWNGLGEWERQDPGFPDTVFRGKIQPTPGVEIKTWFPFATEITARFKDSLKFFAHDQTMIAVLAWLPEHVIYGKPKLVGAWIGSAREMATYRDTHYHKPPDYLVLEPEDTSDRTRNLQQTNVNGYKFQGTADQLAKAEKEIQQWGANSKTYDVSPDYQAKLQSLIGRYNYRLDTNFAKIDRIQNASLEVFKQEILNLDYQGTKVKDWPKVLAENPRRIAELLDLPWEASEREVQKRLI